MGYTTDFEGTLKLNKKLSDEDKTFLTKLAETRRMARKLDPKYGVEGEFYVDGGGLMGQDTEINVIDSNRPPSTQPSLWLHWVPTEDGMGIEWDYGEKFYNYVEWLEYLVENILKPRGYVLNGQIKWFGEEREDNGIIVVTDNKVETFEGKIVYREQ